MAAGTGLIQVLADGGRGAGLTVLGQSGNDWRTQGAVTSGDTANGPHVTLTTPDFTGAIAAVESTQAWYQRRWGGAVTFRITTGSSITTVRIVVGLSSVPGAKMQTPTAHMAAFVYDTVPHGSAYWRAITSDGSGTLTTTTTTAGIATSTLYELRVDMSDGANVKFYVDGTLYATNTGNLPTNTEPMRVGAWVAEIATGGFA